MCRATVPPVRPRAQEPRRAVSDGEGGHRGWLRRAQPMNAGGSAPVWPRQSVQVLKSWTGAGTFRHSAPCIVVGLKADNATKEVVSAEKLRRLRTKTGAEAPADQVKLCCRVTSRPVHPSSRRCRR